MNYEVYSYWNLFELEGTFNAIAALVSSNDFIGFIRLLALIAIISLAIAVLSGRARHEDFWRWVFMLALINGMMLVPKATVVLIDRTSTQPNRVVANVPIGLAALAHGTSKIGDWLTRAYETIFALPNDIQFQENGLMFGHRILTDTVKWSPELASGTWMRDYQEFWRECVMPDIASGYLSVDQLNQSHDIWNELSNTNPALYVTLTTTGTVSCPEAYTNLNTRLNGQVIPAMIKMKADMYYPGIPTAETNLKNAIMTAFSYGLGVSNTPENIVKQQMLINASLNAYCNTFAQLGDPNKAALCYSSSMGSGQTNYTYQVLAKIAESSMPKLKSTIELIQYAVFPIIISIAVVAGHFGISVLKAYVMSLVWIQLWPPLYAIVHYIQTIKLPEYANILAGLGDTMVGQTNLIQIGVSDQAIAGILVLAIPPIAAALVKGGEVGLQAVAGLVSAPKTAERQAAENAKGNESLGQWKSAPSVEFATSPEPVMRKRDDSGIFTMQFPDGSQAIDASGIQHKMNIKANMGSRLSAALQKQSEEAETASYNSMVSAAKTIASTLQQSIDFANSHAKAERDGSYYGMGDQTAFTQSVNEAQKIVNNFAKKHGLTESQSAEILGAASTGFKTPEVLKEFFSINTSLGVQGASGASTHKLLEDAISYVKETGFSKAVEKMKRAAHEETYDSSDESSRRAMDSIRAGFDQAQQQTDQASASYQKSLALKEAATRARENSAAWEAGMLRQFVDWMGTQYNPYSGRNFDAVTVANIAENNPEMLVPFIDKFINEKIDISTDVGNLITGKDIQEFHQRNTKEALLKINPGQSYTANRQNIKNLSNDNGVDPEQKASSQVPKSVNQEFTSADQTITGKAQDNNKQYEQNVRPEDLNKNALELFGRAIMNLAGPLMNETNVRPDGQSDVQGQQGMTGPGSGPMGQSHVQGQQGMDEPGSGSWGQSLFSDAKNNLKLFQNNIEQNLKNMFQDNDADETKTDNEPSPQKR